MSYNDDDDDDDDDETADTTWTNPSNIVTE